MRTIITLILIFSTLLIQAQTFEDFITKAGNLYDSKQYQESGQKYTKAFQLKEGNANQYYNAACSWSLASDTVQSIKYLGLSAKKGWKNLKHIKSDADLLSLHSIKGWQGVLEIVRKNLDEYEKDFNKPLKQQLEKIQVQDQTLRQLYQYAEEKFGRESDEMKYFWELVAEQDSLNEIEVVKIIEKYGWVGTSLVGGYANMTLWLVIQHAPLEVQEKYLYLLQESVKKGESRGSHLALLEDRILMRNDKPQTYGSQVIIDKKTGKYVLYEVKDPEHINQRRKEVGLGSIQNYIKRWEIAWTIEQKEKQK